jgi:hypothetical protein
MWERIKEEPAKLVIWTVAFICATVLVALGKAPPSTFEYLLIYVAGAVQLRKGPGALPENKETEDESTGQGKR